MRRDVGWEESMKTKESFERTPGRIGVDKECHSHFSKQRVLWPAAAAAAPCSPTALRRQFRMEKNRILILDFCCCSVTQLCLTICNPMDCSTPGFPVLHHLLEVAQTHVHWVRWWHSSISSSVIPFSYCFQSFPASGSFSMSQVFASVAKVLELQLQHQSFQWIFRTDFL